MEVKKIQQFLFVFADEQIKRRFVSQTLPRLTVHMIEDIVSRLTLSDRVIRAMKNA